MLVCALADAPMVVAGSVFDRACGRCKRQVMIAPTGQDLLKRRPELDILCGECFAAAIVALEIAAVFELPAAPDETIEDRRN
jgi:hypothetical protein